MRRFGDAILDAVAEGIVIVDRDGRIVRANRRAEERFGYGPGVLEGQVLEVLLPDRVRARHAEHRAGFFAAPRQRRMGMGLELAGRRANGDEFPIEVSLSFVRTNEGEFGLVFVTARLAHGSMPRPVASSASFPVCNPHAKSSGGARGDS